MMIQRMLKDFSIDVVIPTFNEQEIIQQTLGRVLTFLKQNVGNFGVLVVDDGSSDQTVRLVKKIATHQTALKIIANSANRGKGAVVRQGLAATKRAYTLFLDADLATDITELRQLPQLLSRKADIYISSRYLKSSRILMAQPWRRRILSRTANLAVRTFLLPGIKDTQNGFKIFSREALEKIIPRMTLEGWLFDIELLFGAKKTGLTIYEFPISWRNRAASRFSLLKDLKKSWPELRLLLHNIRNNKYSPKD